MTGFRRTKIVATLGPATDAPGALRRLLAAGADVVRLNASHAPVERQRARIAAVRAAEAAIRRPVPVLVDLGGPKIRAGALPGGAARLRRGETLVLAPEGEAREGEIPVNYPRLAEDVSPGERILADDGLLEWRVERARGGRVFCRALNDGVLKSRKGLNFPGVRLSLPALTRRDRRDARAAVAAGADALALSFVRRAADVRELRSLLRRCASTIPIVAKIEKPEALDDLPAILEEADGVMVARGDLGVEVPPESVPEIQKRIIRLANAAEVPVITATQMLESMVENPRPTRAEASDVANAIFDGSDAVMLSAETAVGRHPSRAVAMMAEIAGRAEASEFLSGALEAPGDRGIAHAVARAACQTARDIDASAAVCFTESGRTALLLSKFMRGRPIFAVTRRPAIARRATLYAGVLGVALPMPRNTDAMIAIARRHLLSRRLVGRGDLVVIVTGTTRARGATNLLKVDSI